MREDIEAGRRVQVVEMSGHLAEKARTHALKTPVLEDLIADDLASGQAVFILPSDREELAAALWRAFETGTPPPWLPQNTSVTVWNPLQAPANEREGHA